MNRRHFFRGIALGVASIPFHGKLWEWASGLFREKNFRNPNDVSRALELIDPEYYPLDTFLRNVKVIDAGEYGKLYLRVPPEDVTRWADALRLDIGSVKRIELRGNS